MKRPTLPRLLAISWGLCLIVCCTCELTRADETADANWGHWRGPTGNSTSLTATPPVKWSSSENVRWKTPVPGSGSGSPIVWDDQVIVTTAVPTGNNGGRFPELSFQVHSFDKETGKAKWQQTAIVATPHAGTHRTNGFASASPCTDGKRIYASFGSRGLFCYGMDGTPLWQRTDFPPMTTRAGFGEGSSPTIAGDVLLLPWDQEGSSFLYAINSATGKTKWKTPRNEPTCWATPLVVEGTKGKQVVMNGQTMARGYDLATGQELWRCGGQTQRPVATPVAMDDLVFVGSGFRGSFLGAFRLDGRGNVENTDAVAWTIQQDTPDIASLLLSEDRLYFHKAKTGILSCVDASTGKPLFGPERLPEIRTLYASPVAANGHLYTTGRSGTTVVIKDAADLQIVSVNNLGEGIDATPALAGDSVFLRATSHLYRISE